MNDKPLDTSAVPTPEAHLDAHPQRLPQRLGEALLALLEREMQAVIEHDAETLGRLQDEKAPLLRSLEQAGALGPVLDAPTRTTLRQCREQNQRIGTMLEMRRRHAERALDILYGIPETGAVYDDRGGARKLTTSRYETQA